MTYKILPHRFERLGGEVFISNEVGEFLHLPNNEFEAFISKNLQKDTKAYNNLKSKQIIADNSYEDVLEMLAIKYRTKKHFLDYFTALHMVVVTLRCNSNCAYCQVSKKSVNDLGYDMNKATGKKVVDKIFESPSPKIKIEFQGGEPLLNFSMVKYIIKLAEWKNLFQNKSLEFVICTNLTLIDEKKIKWLKQHNVFISTSIDGPLELHNKNRPLLDQKNSFDLVVEKINLCRKHLGEDSVSALMTASSYTLNEFSKIIDTYIDLGFNSIFLRSLNPYGFAKRDEHFLAYPMDSFLEKYKEALDYIINLNINGLFFIEDFASIILSRILTPFSTGFVDLQSPAGVAISGAIYDYDGDVYVSDEGRMLAATGDKKFKIGNVNQDHYRDIFNGHHLHELMVDSVAESLPECSTCAYLPYCGADPVRNYSEQGDIIGHRPTSEICKKNKFIIKLLLSLIRKNNQDINKVLWSWILKRPIE